MLCECIFVSECVDKMGFWCLFAWILIKKLRGKFFVSLPSILRTHIHDKFARKLNFPYSLGLLLKLIRVFILYNTHVLVNSFRPHRIFTFSLIWTQLSRYEMSCFTVLLGKKACSPIENSNELKTKRRWEVISEFSHQFLDFFPVFKICLSFFFHFGKRSKCMVWLCVVILGTIVSFFCIYALNYI